jgi:hypothetical protein
MSIFFTDTEIEIVNKNRSLPDYRNLYWGMFNRVQKYCDSPGLPNSDTSTGWWHHSAEYLSEAAFIYKLTMRDDKLKAWLRSVTLEIVRRPDDDWIGPFFRDHQSSPKYGNLETAHLSIAVSLVIDLCSEIFSTEEINEIKDKLINTAVPLCINWLKSNLHLSNWRCILLAGIAVPAAVLDERKLLDFVAREYKICLETIQDDGSYAESLQYANYSYWGIMFIYESLIRSNPELANTISCSRYAKAARWFVHSFFYNKPLAGWGAYPLPRFANFNDSGAVFSVDPDLLMHISCRAKDTIPEEAGLAKWLFDKLYAKYPSQGPFDRNTFGFFNRYSFFSMIFYLQSTPSLAPEEIEMLLTKRYNNGDCLTRNSWEKGKTILAFKGAPDGLNAPGHLHADLNSLILVHNKERLLVDPGHSCYRNVIHDYEISTKAHNTCTFVLPDGRELQQRTCASRKIFKSGEITPPVECRAKHLIAERIDEVTVFGSDAANSYGEPLEKFERFCILCGEHALFIVDRIEASEAVHVNWNWLFNNRDERLEYKFAGTDKMVIRRGNAGMKFFHLSTTGVKGPKYGYVHDAYHLLPGQLGEGKTGSGLHFTWYTETAVNSCVRVHAVALDSYGMVAAWHLVNESDGSASWKGEQEEWNLKVDQNKFIIVEKSTDRTFIVSRINNKWIFQKDKVL